MNDRDTKLVIHCLNSGSVNALLRLQQQGLDLKAMGPLPLEIACSRNDARLALFLLNQGVEDARPITEEKSARWWAAYHNNECVLRHLNL
jgi:hypothetical protein